LRRFELLLLFAAAFAVFWPVVFGVRPRRGIVALFLVGALFLQLQFEGFRWQMIPIYVGAVALAIGDIFFLERKLDWSSRLLRALLGVVGLVLAGALPLLLPVPELPSPAGPEAIGTSTFYLIDRDRDELYSDRPGGPRELSVQIWYPANPSEEVPREPWNENSEVVAPAIARGMGYPSWFWSQTKYTLSHARRDLSVVEGTFPVLIYSHSYGGLRTDSLSHIEHLVSNGYIVVAPDHTYLAAATVIESNEAAYLDPDAIPDPEDDATTDEAFAQAETDLVATTAGDLLTVLTALHEGESGAFGAITTAMDLNRVGVYGHGSGGGAAIKVCLQLPDMCGAVLTMDAWVEPLTEEDLQSDMIRPALYMRSEEWVGNDDDALLSGIAARGQAITYTVGIDGATTNDFLMIPLLTPVANQLGLKGPIPAGRVITIVDNYLLGFFDVMLLGTGSAALDSVTFEEVDVSVFQPSG
jgi:predicted dienelactone hydrolase